MDRETQAKMRQKILAAKREIERELSEREVIIRNSLGEATGELASYDNHPADLGTEIFERSKDLAWRQGLKARLKEIEAALEKLAQGSYGICQICGQAIARERLEALPATTLCKACKQEMESTGRRNPRPVEEELLDPNFGFLQEEHEKLVDGEDAWQKVARYGSAAGPQDLPETTDYD